MDFFPSLITHINIKDLIDVFIVSILIYQILLIVRGTKAVQMIFGVGILFILFWIGVTFKLYSLNEADYVAELMDFENDETENLNTRFGNRNQTFEN